MMKFINTVLIVFFYFTGLCPSFACDMENLPWHLKVNKVPDCWDMGIHGNKVIAEVWDSKANFNSTLLKNKLYDKVDCENNLESDCDKARYKIKPLLHGTAMASLIAANYGKIDCFNGSYPCKCEHTYVAGIAPKTKILNKIIIDPCGEFITADRFQQLISSLKLRNQPSIEDSVNEYGEKIFISEQDVKEAKIVLINASFFEGNEKYTEIGDLKKLDNFKHLLIVAGVEDIVKKLDKNNLPKPASLKFVKGLNVIVVSATNDYSDNKKVDILNYGNEEGYAGVAYGRVVDILAPGQNISCIAHTMEGCITDGASMATAIVTGTIALLASCNPYATAAELKNELLDNSDKYEVLKDKVDDGRVLNIYKAVNKYSYSLNKLRGNKKDKKIDL